MNINLVDTKEYKLKDIVEITKGTFNTKDTDNSGKYPYYNSGFKNPSGSHSNFSCDHDECIIFVKDGGDKKNPLNEKCGMCKPFFVKGKVAVNNCNLIFKKLNKKEFILKYIYMYLEYNRKDLMKNVKYNSGLGHVSIETIKNHIVKIPSLDNQKKIIEEITKIELQQKSYENFSNILQNNIDQLNIIIKNICNDNNIDYINNNYECIDNSNNNDDCDDNIDDYDDYICTNNFNDYEAYYVNNNNDVDFNAEYDMIYIYSLQKSNIMINKSESKQNLKS